MIYASLLVFLIQKWVLSNAQEDENFIEVVIYSFLHAQPLTEYKNPWVHFFLFCCFHFVPLLSVEMHILEWSYNALWRCCVLNRTVLKVNEADKMLSFNVHFFVINKQYNNN